MATTRPQRFDDSRQIVGVQTDKALDKLRYFLARGFTCCEVADSGPHVRLHFRISIDDTNQLHLRVFDNSTVNCSAPPGAPSETTSNILNQVIACCKSSAYQVSNRRFASVARAQAMLEWLENLPLDGDVARVVTVVLSDTVIEMLVTEMMRERGIVEANLLREGIPNKLDRLLQNGLLIYRDADIRQLRQLRNRAVHEGGLPYDAEATAAETLARDFSDHY